MSVIERITDRTKPLRLVDPTPKIGTELRNREPIVVPQRIYDWGTDWIQEVGTILRSRSFIASYLAGGAISLARLALLGQKIGGQ